MKQKNTSYQQVEKFNDLSLKDHYGFVGKFKETFPLFTSHS